jgi:hypothetical protein
VALGRFAINYSSSQGFSGGLGILDAIRGTFGRPESLSVSMGRARDTDNPYVGPRSILSQVGNAAAEFAAAQVLGQGSRSQPAQVPQPVPQTFAAQGPQTLEPLVKQGTNTMSLDLGNLLGNLGSQYISARWGGGGQPTVFIPPAPTLPPPIMAQGPRAGIAPTPALAGPNLFELGQQGFDYMFGPDTPTAPGAPMQNGCTPPSYCVDGKTGKVTIKQKRRRRRRLATSSDIRDLSSLKSVLSPADLKMWIATHPS